MSKSLKRVQRALMNAGVASDLLEMPGGTRTAAEAVAAGCALDQISKSIAPGAKATGEAILFITAGGDHLNTSETALFCRWDGGQTWRVTLAGSAIRSAF